MMIADVGRDSGDAERRLALAGLALLLVGALYLLGVTVVMLHERHHLEANARAQIVADGLALQLGNALALGIPLRRLEGVTALFDKVMRENHDIATIALRGPDERELWKAGSAGRGAIESIRVSVREGDFTRAVLVLGWRDSTFAAVAWRAALALSTVVLVTALAAAEAGRCALGRGRRLRAAIVQSSSEAAAVGRFDTLYVGARRRAFDLRPQWLARAMRRVNEQHVRSRRLIESLRQTEPNIERRRMFDRLLGQATSGDRFAVQRPRVIRMVASQALMRWLVLLVGCASQALRVLWLPELRGLASWGIALDAVGVALGLILAVRLRRSMFVLALAAIVAVMLALTVNALSGTPAVLLAMRALAGCATGLLGALVVSVPVAGPRADHPAQRATLLVGWLLGAEFLGPVIGTVSAVAFSPVAAGFLQILPLLVAVVCLSRLASSDPRWRGVATWTGLEPARGSWLPGAAGCLMFGATLAQIAAGNQAVGTMGWSLRVAFWLAAGCGVLAAVNADRWIALPRAPSVLALVSGAAVMALAIGHFSGDDKVLLLAVPGIALLGFGAFRLCDGMRARMDLRNVLATGLGAALVGVARQYFDFDGLARCWLGAGLTAGILIVLVWRRGQVHAD